MSSKKNIFYLFIKMSSSTKSAFVRTPDDQMRMSKNSSSTKSAFVKTPHDQMRMRKNSSSTKSAFVKTPDDQIRIGKNTFKSRFCEGTMRFRHRRNGTCRPVPEGKEVWQGRVRNKCNEGRERDLLTGRCKRKKASPGHDKLLSWKNGVYKCRYYMDKNQFEQNRRRPV